MISGAAWQLTVSVFTILVTFPVRVSFRTRGLLFVTRFIAGFVSTMMVKDMGQVDFDSSDLGLNPGPWPPKTSGRDKPIERA